jgi:hypothetical protein
VSHAIGCVEIWNFRVWSGCPACSDFCLPMLADRQPSTPIFRFPTPQLPIQISVHSPNIGLKLGKASIQWHDNELRTCSILISQCTAWDADPYHIDLFDLSAMIDAFGQPHFCRRRSLILLEPGTAFCGGQTERD